MVSAKELALCDSDNFDARRFEAVGSSISGCDSPFALTRRLRPRLLAFALTLFPSDFFVVMHVWFLSPVKDDSQKVP